MSDALGPLLRQLRADMREGFARVHARLDRLEKQLGVRSKQPVTNGRTVKKVLADGSVRTYHYVPHASRANGKKPSNASVAAQADKAAQLRLCRAPYNRTTNPHNPLK
jgi:hypothetical protein